MEGDTLQELFGPAILRELLACTAVFSMTVPAICLGYVSWQELVARRRGGARCLRESVPGDRCLLQDPWLLRFLAPLGHLLCHPRSVASRFENKRWCSWQLASRKFREFYSCQLLLVLWASMEVKCAMWLGCFQHNRRLCQRPR